MTRASGGEPPTSPLTDNSKEAGRAFSAVVEATDVGTIKLDDSGTIVATNDRFCELVGQPADHLHGRLFTSFLPTETAVIDSVRGQLDRSDADPARLSTTILQADGHPVHCDLWLQRLGDDAASGTILVVVKPTPEDEPPEPDPDSQQPTADLERYKTIVETIHDGVYITNEDDEFEMVNAGYASIVGYDREELIGEHVSTVVDDEVIKQGHRLRAAMRDGEREGGAVDITLERADGEEVAAETRFALLPSDDGSFKGTVGVVRNLESRTERVDSLERQVRQQRALADFGQQALTDRDLDGLFETATDLVASTLNIELTKVLDLDETQSHLRLRAGVGWRDGLVGTATVGTEQTSQAGYTLLSAEPVVVTNLDAETRFSGPDLLVDHDVVSGISVIIGPPDDPWGVFGAHTKTTREFTEQDVSFVRNVANILAAAISRTERERELERYETIVETIWDGVYALDPNENFVMVNDALCEMTGYDREELLGNHANLAHNETVRQQANELTSEIRSGYREMATLEFDLTKKDGTSIPAEARLGPYPYSDEVDGRAGVVRDITERKAWERQVETLNELNEVVREITHAIVESTAREDVERLVCERFAAADSYEFAWLATESDDSTLEPIAEAGVSGYLEEWSGDPTAQATDFGPTGRALQERTAVFSRNILEDEAYEHWHDDARERGYHSVAAIPIGYQNLQYGVLTLHSARPDAFGENERKILSQVGDVIGHAINAMERKAALMADRITEVTFRSGTLPETLAALGDDLGEVTIDRAVPLNNGTVLQYHTVRKMNAAAYEAAIADDPSVREVRTITTSETVTRLEILIEEPTAGSILATYGGRLHTVTFAPGRVEIEAELPETVDVRQVSDAVREHYPDIDLVSRNTVNRQVAMPEELAESLIGQLTDRQRTALKSAYYAGFFDWPRESAGTDVAESLDVSPATFHEHLRRAQRKLLAALFEGSPTAD
ncbi:PAS domain S-box protein [Haladaptatus sp. YSMS36]|uniref:PAS domain S-box protein n=1 Tax=Haladaptatus sp. YSMS36 TaxID=3033384 RepID=UPI0023E8EC2F|nr:PAS domain S-box protein [Haladaptatus sp. YSMS36]